MTTRKRAQPVAPMHEWETVDRQVPDERTQRMTVPGGWIYRQVEGPPDRTICMVYVPAPPWHHACPVRASCPREDALSAELDGWDEQHGVLSTQAVDGRLLHQHGADQAGELGEAFDCALRGMRELEQHEGDQRHRDLDRHRALAGAVEMADPQQLLDPAEEQLDRPAAPIQRRDLLGRRIEVVGEQSQHR